METVLEAVGREGEGLPEEEGESPEEEGAGLEEETSVGLGCCGGGGGFRIFLSIRRRRICDPSSSLPETVIGRGESVPSLAVRLEAEEGRVGGVFEPSADASRDVDTLPLSLMLFLFIFFNSEGLGLMDLDLFLARLPLPLPWLPLSLLGPAA